MAMEQSAALQPTDQADEKLLTESRTNVEETPVESSSTSQSDSFQQLPCLPEPEPEPEPEPTIELPMEITTSESTSAPAVAVETNSIVNDRRIQAKDMFTPPVGIVADTPPRDSRIIPLKAKTKIRSTYREADTGDSGRSSSRKFLSANGNGSVKIRIPKLQVLPPMTIKSELSALIKEIHNCVFEEHKLHPAPVWSNRITDTVYVDDKKSVPTCNDLLDAHEINAAAIPEMNVQDVGLMVGKLFGPKRENLCEIFEKEQIDGAGLLLLNMHGYLNLLRIPIGPAVTLDGIVKRARELRNIPPPSD